MRFVLGLAIGFGIGLGGAILFAPEKKKPAPDWLPAQARASIPGNGAQPEGGLKSVLAKVRTRLDEAMSEAREAQQQAERDMQARYERSVGKK